MFTVAQFQSMVASDLGRAGNPKFAAGVAEKWLLAETMTRDTSLRYLLCRKLCIQALQGGEWENYDYDEDGVSESREQPFEHLSDMLKAVEADIETRKKQLRAGGVAVGRLSAQTPQAGDLGRPDPNARGYRGDPLRPHGCGYRGPNDL